MSTIGIDLIVCWVNEEQPDAAMAPDVVVMNFRRFIVCFIVN